MLQRISLKLLDLEKMMGYGCSTEEITEQRLKEIVDIVGDIVSYLNEMERGQHEQLQR